MVWISLSSSLFKNSFYNYFCHFSGKHSVQQFESLLGETLWKCMPLSLSPSFLWTLAFSPPASGNRYTHFIAQQNVQTTTDPYSLFHLIVLTAKYFPQELVETKKKCTLTSSPYQLDKGDNMSVWCSTCFRCPKVAKKTVFACLSFILFLTRGKKTQVTPYCAYNSVHFSKGQQWHHKDDEASCSHLEFRKLSYIQWSFIFRISAVPLKSLSWYMPAFMGQEKSPSTTQNEAHNIPYTLGLLRLVKMDIHCIVFL